MNKHVMDFHPVMISLPPDVADALDRWNEAQPHWGDRRDQAINAALREWLTRCGFLTSNEEPR